VELDQLLDQGQADAGAFVGPNPRPLDAVEAFEDVRQLLLGDAGPVIADRQLDPTFSPRPLGESGRG
jgi:hypothetical protein